MGNDEEAASPTFCSFFQSTCTLIPAALTLGNPPFPPGSLTPASERHRESDGENYVYTRTHRGAASGHARHESLLKNSASASPTSEPTRLTTALSLPASPGRHNIHQIPPPPPPSPLTLNHQQKMVTVKQQLVSRITPVFQGNCGHKNLLWCLKRKKNSLKNII